MGWRKIVLPTLALALALITPTTIIYGVEVLPPTGSLNKVSKNPIELIPTTYGPCKICRDLILHVELGQRYFWSPDTSHSTYIPAGVVGQNLLLIIGQNEYWISDSFCAKYGTPPVCRHNYMRNIIARDVAGLLIYVRYGTNIWAEDPHLIYVHVNGYRWTVHLYIINSRFYWASAVVGSRVVRLEGGVNGGSPPTLTKTVSGSGLFPIITRISWDNWLYYKTPAYATANASINYYYTLELGLLARAYWLNGSLVNLPSIGIVDGWISTKYWKVVRVFPASAFSRGHPVVLHDNYMYYVYYVVPNRVFHVVVTPSFVIVLNNGTSCLPDTWCPVAEKRCGTVVLYCKAKRDALTVALPTDWNTTVEYVCTLNSTRGLVDLKLESIAILYNNKTVIGTIYNVGSWNLTHLASGVMYSGKFPAENFVCSNSTYRVDVSKTFTLKLNGTLLAVCNISHLDLLTSRIEIKYGSTVPETSWILVRSVSDSSLSWFTDSRAWQVVAYYNCSIRVKLCYVHVLAYDVNGSQFISIPVSFMDRYNGSIVKAGVEETPFTLAVPCNSTLLLRASDSWKNLVFMYWRGTYVNSSNMIIMFNVTRQYGKETAFYRSVNVSRRRHISSLCPVILSTTLSRIWLTSYLGVSNPLSNVSVSAFRVCRCNCSTSCRIIGGRLHCFCTNPHIVCRGLSSDSNSVTRYGSLGGEKIWIRVLEAGTLRIPVLEDSGWRICAGLYLGSISIRNSASIGVRASVSTSENSIMHCGCSVDYSVSATASASINSLSLLYSIYSIGNIFNMLRNIEHTYTIGKSLSKSLNKVGSRRGLVSWSGSWSSSSVEGYGGSTSWRIYDIYGGYYRHNVLRAVSRFSLSGRLVTYAYASVDIIHDPNSFTCNCNHCGSNCTCNISAISTAYVHTYLKIRTRVTDSRLILRAGLAVPGSGWLKPRFNRLVCSNYGCIWYSNRDPWHHTGILSIHWSPTYPLPGQPVRIVVTFSTGDNQPVRLWVYRVVEHYWSVKYQRWVTKRYRPYLYTPWEISEAPRGSASISFSWKMPNGYLTICAAGWGVFTGLVEEC